MTDLPDGAFEMGTLVRFAGYSFLIHAGTVVYAADFLAL